MKSLNFSHYFFRRLDLETPSARKLYLRFSCLKGIFNKISEARGHFTNPPGCLRRFFKILYGRLISEYSRKIQNIDDYGLSDPLTVFKFPGSPSIYIKCKLKFCVDALDGNCLTVGNQFCQISLSIAFLKSFYSTYNEMKRGLFLRHQFHKIMQPVMSCQFYNEYRCGKCKKGPLNAF